MNPATPFARAVELIAPGASCRQLAAKFRVDPVSISRWKRGPRKPPHAIIERVQAEIAEGNRARQEAAQALSAGIPPGTQGAATLRRWRAQRAKEKGAD